MARRVFHRLGLPSPSSIAKFIKPGCGFSRPAAIPIALGPDEVIASAIRWSGASTLFPEWTSSSWTLMLLRAFGLDPASAEARQAVLPVNASDWWAVVSVTRTNAISVTGTTISIH